MDSSEPASQSAVEPFSRVRAADLSAERRLVTVMFADISGFTAFAEKSDPEAARDLINACFTRFVPIIRKYGGTVDKFIGDAVMALFGAPAAHENDPERALRAALDMMDALVLINAEQSTDLGLHFGINTGLVIAGGIGPADREEYSVIGDAVNLAARLEGLSERGEILIGPDTWRLTCALFDFDEPRPVSLKGKSEPVLVYRLRGARVAPSRGRGITGLDSPLVGRRAELAVLGRALGRLAMGEGGIVTLVGEAGLGKTRLLAEARKLPIAECAPPDSPPRRGSAAPHAARVWVDGRCPSHGASLPYTLWLDVLRTLLHVSSEAPPAEASRTLRESVRALDVDRPELVHARIGRLMSLPIDREEEKLLEEAAGSEARSTTHAAVEELLGAASRQNPLVIVCEDLHWADRASLELLEHLMPLAERSPLLFVCAMRPEKQHGSWRLRSAAAERLRGRHDDLVLSPLSAEETTTLIGNLLLAEDLPDSLPHRILDRAEGNPFYVEEILRSLMDRGAIVRDAVTHRWTATEDMARMTIPDTVQGVLAARIDRLERDTRRVLQVASVIGRVFFYRVLAAIAREEQALDERLLDLQQQDMIREWARAPELEFVFRHHLTQEAAYNGLLKKERRQFHQQVAEALERLFPDRVEEQVGPLAYHWERAEHPEKAVEYLGRAGDYARMALAHSEAVDFYRRALRFLKARGRFDEAARTLMKLGLTHQSGFDFEQSRRAYDEGFAMWQLATTADPVVHPAPAPHALRIVEDEPVSADPARTTDLFSQFLQAQLFSPLVETSPDLNVVPEAARSWEIREGGKSYVFHLRDDLVWSDGVPLTARDYEYAWKRILAPDTNGVTVEMLFDVRGARAYHEGTVTDERCVGVRALDARTLAVDLEEPVSYFLQALYYAAFAALPRHAIERQGDAWAEPGNLVISGPFRLASWERGRRLVLERNPSYHGRFAGNLRQVEWSFSTSEVDSLAHYHDNGIDVLNLMRLSPSQIRRAGEQYPREYFRSPMMSSMMLVLDTTRPPFSDPRVRQAFAISVNRLRMADVTLDGWLLPATGGFLPPNLPGFAPPAGFDFDPGKARELLAEAGFHGGRGFPHVVAPCADTPISAAITRFLQEQWEGELGVRVEWQSMSSKDFYGQLFSAPPHLYVIGNIATFPDPDDLLRGLRQFGAGWPYPDLEELMAKGRVTADQRLRMELYQQADRLIIETAAFQPLGYGRSHMLVKPWVRRYPISPICWAFWKDVVIEPH